MISVIIPVYNTPKELEKCLASLAKQSFSDPSEISDGSHRVNFEVIVVDDGSKEKVKSQKSKVKIEEDSIVKFFRIEHGGAPSARNFGMEQAKGDYILFCDADMELRPDCLEKMLMTLENNFEASYVYSDFKYGWKKFKFWPFDADKLRQMNYVNTCSLIRRSALAGVKWDESLEKFQDWDLWLQLLDKGRTGVHIPEILFKVNLGTGTMSKWLPRFMYKLPIGWENKRRYEEGRRVVQIKHGIKD